MNYNTALIFDGEVGTTFLNKTHRDNMPWNPENKMVSWHYKYLSNLSCEDTTAREMAEKNKSLILYHNEYKGSDCVNKFKDLYKTADVCVAHNMKFDENWARSIGFGRPKNRWCTMVAEYLLARGNYIGKSLKETAERREVSAKKDDLTHEEFKSGKEYYEIDLDAVIEYGEADVQSCAEIFLEQLKEFKKPENKGLIPTVFMTNEFTDFLLELEQEGIKIDRLELEKVATEYEQEKDQLEKWLEEKTKLIMGDIPCNLQSGPDLSALVYSRDLVRKESWKTIMKIGTDHRGKKFYPPRYKPSKFVSYVHSHFETRYKKKAVRCENCQGTGFYRKVKVDGSFYKNFNMCPVCKKLGATFEDVEKGKKKDGSTAYEVAGLKMAPQNAADASAHGFKTDKQTLQRLIERAKNKKNDLAVEFLTKLIRLQAVNTYVDTFVKGINLFTRDDDIIHPNFNQTVTATGRLSSSNPNWQNMPKGGKFPIRKAVVSRFQNGWIYEFDYRQLEFRVAGELSQDQKIVQQVKDGFDVHTQTAAIIHQCDTNEVTKDQRSQAKATTFSPLYGGRGANSPPHIKRYFDSYYDIYTGLKEWHYSLFQQALDTGIITVPSGREYKFPNVERLRNNRVTNSTNICNYPVQGFSTADLVPLACIRTIKKFRQLGLLSKPINCVHDSIVVDVHPAEEDQVIAAIKWAMEGVVDEAKDRWQYSFHIPLDIEAAKGRNWMDIKEIDLD